MHDIDVTINTAIPLGLVLTELISNVFKHAFPKEKKGNLFIELKQNENNDICLKIADGGIGLDKEINLRDKCSMGLENVFSIIEYQLRGKVNYKIENGLIWNVVINDNNYLKRV